MRALNSNPNIDNSDLPNYPDGRIKDNTGTGNGTGVNENVYGDLHQAIAKLMRQYGIAPTGFPDNETNGFQIVEAFKALASKNDYVYPLTTNGTILNVGIKFAYMQTNEFILCLAGANLGTETQITGIGAGTFGVTYSGVFKANEYVRVIKTNIGISIIRVADWNSLDAMIGDLNYLKKATQAQENAGTTDTVATTPLVNLVAFTRRVIGADSGVFLATLLRNGLYPKEHFAIVAGIGASPVKNYGTVSFDPSGGNLDVPCDGNFTSAHLTTDGNRSYVAVTMANAMDMTKGYYCRSFIQGQSADNLVDCSVGNIVFKPMSSTIFHIAIRDLDGSTQALKVHVEVVQL